MDKLTKVVLIAIVIIGIVGVAITLSVKHYQGGEIYEASNDAMNYLVRGFNVTIKVETVDGKIISGELFSAQGSTITIIVNGTRVTVGGPAATKENFRAKHIEVIKRGKVYVYEVPGTEGEGYEEFSKYIKEETYSERFSGTIYVENISIIEIGKLKYLADYTTYGSITINKISGNNAILTASMVPVEILRDNLKGKRVFFYGILLVNSENRTHKLTLIEVRS